MKKTMENICNRDGIRQCGIIFITLISQIIFCEGGYATVDPYKQCHDEVDTISHTFDPLREICCGGKVFDNSLSEYSCHKNEIYLHYEEFFCGDQKLKIGGERDCCKGEVYNTSQSSCCDGVRLPKQENMVCCGKELINSTEKTCCQGNLVVNGVGECCGRSDTLYNPDTEVCIYNTVYEMPAHGDPLSLYGICEGTLYDTELEICCEGEVNKKNGTYECKWGQWYDVAEKVLNTHGLVDIVDGKTRFCGSQMYNPNVEVCCESQGRRKITNVGSANGACCGGVAYSKDNASCCQDVITAGIPEIPEIQACSGNVSYLNSGNISCSPNSVLPRYSREKVDCCGGQPFLVDSSVCCMGVIKDKVGTGVCCGTTVLFPNQHCINDKVVRGREGENRLCKQYLPPYNDYNQQPSRVIPYNSDLFICKKGALVPKKQKMKYCTGSGEVYNKDKELCCGNYRVFSKVNEWGLKRRCCGYDAYHPTVQSCFHTHIYNFPEKFAGRCGISLYDNRSHVCIDNHIFAKTVTQLTSADCRISFALKAFGQSCCQGKPINDSAHLCCNNRIYSKSGMEDAQCCSGRVYDNASSDYLCCDNRLHRTGGVTKTCKGRLAVADYEQVCGNMVYNKSEGNCCRNGLFSPDTQLCCDNVRIEKDSENDDCCGTMKYDTSGSKICCNGALYDRKHGFECCGTSLIDPNHEVCIADRFVVSRQFEEFTCNSSITDDPTGTCCAGIMHVQKFGSCDGVHLNEGSDSLDLALWENVEEDMGKSQEEELLTCGDRPYNVATETCCNENVIENAVKICCNGKIRKITELGENSCCGTRAYNNDSSICCGRQVREKSDIQSEDDAKRCCGSGKVFNLESRQCQGRTQEESEEKQTQEDLEGEAGEDEGEDEVCSLCPDTRRSKEEISDLACGAKNVLSVKVTGTERNALTVKVTSLKKCKNCPPISREMRRLKQLLIPGRCNCDVSGGKYILLSSGQLNEDGHLPLQRSDVLLKYKAAKFVIKAFNDGQCGVQLS